MVPIPFCTVAVTVTGALGQMVNGNEEMVTVGADPVTPMVNELLLTIELFVHITFVFIFT